MVEFELTDPVGKHLPGTELGDVPVAQLLSHSAGLHAETDGRPAQLDIASFGLTRTPYDPAADVPGGVDPAGWNGGR